MISCGRKETNIHIYNYPLNSNKVHNLKLNVSNSEGLIDFEYLRFNDSIKTLQLKYNSEKDILISKFDTFLPINKHIKNDFKMYQTKRIRSHKRILVFKESYGLIASIAFGGSSIFMKDSVTKNQKELIFKEIFINLNKISIE